MLHVLLLLAVLCAGVAGPLSMAYAGNVFRVDAREQEELHLDHSLMAFFNHSARYWDDQRTTESAVKRLLTLMRQNKIKTAMTVDPLTLEIQSDRESYFLNSTDVDYTLESEGGSHKIVAPNLATAILAGGHLSYCLCEFLRDLVRGVDFRKDRLDILVVNQATFDSFTAVKHFRLGWEQKFQNPLSQFLRNTGSSLFSQYVHETLFPTNARSEVQNTFCPLQSSSLETGLYTKPYTFTLYLNGKKEAVFGSGDRQVHIAFVNLVSLETELKDSDSNTPKRRLERLLERVVEKDNLIQSSHEGKAKYLPFSVPNFFR